MFLIAFIISPVVSALFSLPGVRYALWIKLEYWKKYLLLGLIYAVNIITILTVTLFLDAKGKLDYFGADAEGSFGMLYIPSAGVYFLLVFW
ncbi:MAG: hypothetical protein NC818_06225 [Candidatus Omnitrophica bacterium]|nr:hypothetical protein [Candidatus Omnitrophota bacterium]